MKVYNVGLIGCGRIGTLLEKDALRGKPCTHAGGFSALSNTKIVAGCDIDHSRLKSFSRDWGVNRLYKDYREMLTLEKLDVVCIATWTNLHASMVMDAARSGVKAIFCEKPIALNLDDARQMVRICKRKSIPLIINHERRWDSYYKKAHQIIKSGKIGEIRTIIGNTLSARPGKKSTCDYGGGALFHDGTHLTDLLLFFAGPAEWVSGHDIRPYGKKHIEETAYGMIGFKSGAMGFIEGGGARKYFNFELDIQGSEGRLLIGNHGRELYLTKKSKRFSGFQELEQVSFPEPKQITSPFESSARETLKCLRTNTDSISNGNDGLKALELIFAIYRSAQLKGKQLKLKPNALH
ncbi:MAG: Gfo/Idh/MocA family protein [Nitrospinaceae bacterium]